MSILKIKVSCLKCDGTQFRPSNWIDRIAILGAKFESNRLKYSKYLYPSYINGEKVLILWETDFKKENPEVFKTVTEFIKEQKLKTEKVKL